MLDGIMILPENGVMLIMTMPFNKIMFGTTKTITLKQLQLMPWMTIKMITMSQHK